jgi:site-specific DNA recombinase
MRAAIYLRVSTEEQARPDKVSLQTQEASCRAYCGDKGYIISHVYSDPGATGGDMERPGLQTLLEDGRSGLYDVAVCYCVDRLARDQNIVGVVDYALDRAGARLEFATEDFADSPIGKLMRQIKGYAAEEERAKIRTRVRMGRRGRAERGLSNATTAPYGYQRSDGLLFVDEHEAAIVRTIYEQFLLGGLALRQIAFGLNTQRIPPKRGSPKGWTGEHVRRILTAERYTGHGWQGCWKKTGKGESMRVPREEWLPLEYPQIIDAATFEAAQAKIVQNRPWRRPPGGDKHLLAGLLRCAECGHTLVCVTGGGNQRRRRAYQCDGQSRRGYDCRTPAWIRAERVDTPVWQAIAEACKNPDLWAAASAAYDATAGALSGDAQALGSDLQHKLQQAEEGRLRLIRLLNSGNVKPDDKQVLQVLAEAEQSIDAWQRELDRTQGHAKDYASQALDRQQAEALAREMGPKVDGLSFDEKRELIRAMVRRIWIDRAGNLTIEAALPYLNVASVDTLTPLMSAKSAPSQTGSSTATSSGPATNGAIGSTPARCAASCASDFTGSTVTPSMSAASAASASGT